MKTSATASRHERYGSRPLMGVSTVLALLLLATGCRGVQSVDIPAATPSPLESPSDVPSASPSGSSATPSPGGGKKPSGPGAKGQADAVISGSGLQGTGISEPGETQKDLRFTTLAGYPFYTGLGYEASLTWVDDQGNALTLGGQVYEGTRPTGGGAFLLDLVLVGVGQVASGNGSCTVTISRAALHSIRGSYDCPSLDLPEGGTITLSGRFAGRVPG